MHDVGWEGVSVGFDFKTEMKDFSFFVCLILQEGNYLLDFALLITNKVKKITCKCNIFSYD